MATIGSDGKVERYKQCPWCGVMIPEDAVACYECGNRI